MIHITTIILFAFILSIICGFTSFPMIMNFCKEKGLYDIPNCRKIHRNPIPRLGGICFMPSMLLSFIIAVLVQRCQFEDKNIAANTWVVYRLFGLFLIYCLGIIDDLIGLNAKIKFTVQIIAASTLPITGIYINNLYGLFGIHEIPFLIGCPLTIFIIVFLNNAMNLIDGIDGLCASLSFLAFAGFLGVFLQEGLYTYCILIAGLMGVLIPYLFFNMFGKIEKNHKIFMGDSGSLTLGFILSFLFVKLSMQPTHAIENQNYKIFFAMSLLMIPSFDAIRVTLHRVYHHKPVFNSDKNHIHHKLMKAGLNQHSALLIILAFAVFYIIANLTILSIANANIMLIADIIIYCCFHLCLNHFIKKKNNE